MENDLQAIVVQAETIIARVASQSDWEQAKASILGPNGSLTQAAKGIGKLSKEERDMLISAVENNKWIPKDVKKRIVKQLSQELVPKKVVDRLRKRLGG